MNFSFHNQLNIKTKTKTYTFYNTVLKSILEKLAKFEKYNEYLSIGNGKPSQEFQNNFQLTNKIFTTKLSNSSFQSDISKGNLFSKYEFLISKKDLNCDYITEIGLSDDKNESIIFNYFSLISDESPNGINIENENEISFEIIIHLTVNENINNILTSGNNPFIEYLLGNGLNDVYITKGTNYCENVRIEREFDNRNLILCNKTSNISDNSLEICFESNINIGEINEILFILNNKVFARRNLKEYNEPINLNQTFQSKENYIIKIEDDIKNVNSLYNNSTQTYETNYYISKYANSLGDKVSLPFNNLFNKDTTRFLAKDGKYIFFVIDDKVYGFVNDNFSIKELNTSEINDDNILKIISFDNFVFVISKAKPYISTYTIYNNTIIKNINNFNSIVNFEKIEKCLQIDITYCKNNQFILGLICEDKTALSIYFSLNNEQEFIFDNEITNNKEFHYLLAMYKNNFCDGQMIYLKEGSTSVECRIVTHSADKTETDIYSSLAYHLTKDARKIYTKNRAIISEKNSNPSVVIYYYPQIYEYNLPLISDEINNYISEDLNYIIQKRIGNEYKIYNLVGYDLPEEFNNSISELVNTSEIEDFEFMKDSLLIFTNNKEEPIICFNFDLNKTQVENVSSKNNQYIANLDKYNKLGSDGKSIKFSFISKVDLWYFLIKYIKLMTVKIQHYFNKIKTH